MTTNEIATTAGSALAIASDQDGFTAKQVAALRQIGAEEANDGDLQVFFHQCQRTGLDPFARQIYLIGRKSRGQMKYTIQTGIDGFRLIASRTGQLDGYEDTLWCGEDGKWTDVWLKRTPPAAAKVTIIRNGARYPAVALFTEYAGTNYNGELTQMWASKGALMLAKCAEALALRKAFPQDLSGLYTSDEMQQANNGQEAAPAPRQQAQSSRPTSITEALAPGDPTVDVESVLDGMAATETVDGLKAQWESVKDQLGARRQEVLDFVTARLGQIRTTEPAPAQESEQLPDSEEGIDAIDAEVVA